jgi:hypothetical protein
LRTGENKNETRKDVEKLRMRESSDKGLLYNKGKKKVLVRFK